MYTAALHLHSHLRWVVLLGSVALLARTAAGWRAGAPWTSVDERLHTMIIGIVDLQFLVGVALYTWLSPLTPAFFADPGPSMKVPPIRFFMLDHPVSMIVAITIIHVWRKKSQRITSGPARHRAVALSTLTALLVISASIPWPGLRYGRELFRG